MNAFKINARFFTVSAEELDSSQQELIRQSLLAADRSYSPYSKFQVGCSIVLDNGQTVTGMNVENAAYSACICAERNALTTALSLYPQARIISLAISHKVNGEEVKNWVSPCGECRQVMVELAEKQGKDYDVFLYGHGNNILWVKNVRDLLPLSFLPKDLGLPAPQNP